MQQGLTTHPDKAVNLSCSSESAVDDVFPDENISLTQGSWAELLHAECDARDRRGSARRLPVGEVAD
jgi:hypothetical protein